MTRFTTRTYRVLDQQIHKYTSYVVSGGGLVGPGGGEVSVHTSTAHHTDQDIWVMDLASGAERKLAYREFTVDVRPGHRVVEVRNRKDKAVRAFNIDTQYNFGRDATYNPWQLTGWHRFGGAALYTTLSLIPGLGLVIAVVVLLVTALSGRYHDADTGIAPIRLIAAGTFLGWLAVLAYGAFQPSSYVSFGNWWMAWHLWPGVVVLAGLIGISRAMTSTSVAHGREISALVQAAEQVVVRAGKHPAAGTP